MSMSITMFGKLLLISEFHIVCQEKILFSSCVVNLTHITKYVTIVLCNYQFYGTIPQISYLISVQSDNNDRNLINVVSNKTVQGCKIIQNK